MAHCCGQSEAGLPRDVLDVVTDRLESCLLLDEGKREFRDFLEKHRFKDDLSTLLFILKCDEILKEVSKWSPRSRNNNNFSRILNTNLNDLYDMSSDVNFDAVQAETLEAAVDEENRNNDEVNYNWILII